MRRMISETPVAHGEYDKTRQRFVLDHGLKQNAFYKIIVSFTLEGNPYNVVGFLDTTFVQTPTCNRTTPMHLYADHDSTPICLEFNNYADQSTSQYLYGYTADFDQYTIKVVRLA